MAVGCLAADMGSSVALWMAGLAWMLEWLFVFSFWFPLDVKSNLLQDRTRSGETFLKKLLRLIGAVFTTASSFLALGVSLLVYDFSSTFCDFSDYSSFSTSSSVPDSIFGLFCSKLSFFCYFFSCFISFFICFSCSICFSFSSFNLRFSSLAYCFSSSCCCLMAAFWISFSSLSYYFLSSLVKASSCLMSSNSCFCCSFSWISRSASS